MSSYSLFLESQIRGSIQSNGVIQRRWMRTNGRTPAACGAARPALAHFIAGLEVENIPNTAILRITYSDPDAKLAFAGAERR